MAHTWKCTLGFLMRIHTDAIQLKALYVWIPSQREILEILRKAKYFKKIIKMIFINALLECVYIQHPLLLLRLNGFGIKILDIRMYVRMGGKLNC
jgi:hypothetical protein